MTHMQAFQEASLPFAAWNDAEHERVMIVLPTYNESENLPLVLDRLFHLQIPGLRVLVINDHSPDGTGDIAEKLAQTLYKGKMAVIHRQGKLGLGTAYIVGFSYALRQDADFIIQMDSDFSHDPKYIPDFLDALKEADVAIGSRYTKGGSLDARWGLERRLLSRWASLYAKMILGLNVKDTTAGFKMFRRHVLQQLPLQDLRSTGYCFQLEIASLCQRHDFRIVEIPIHFQERRAGAPGVFMASWR